MPRGGYTMQSRIEKREREIALEEKRIAEWQEKIKLAQKRIQEKKNEMTMLKVELIEAKAASQGLSLDEFLDKQVAENEE